MPEAKLLFDVAIRRAPPGKIRSSLAVGATPPTQLAGSIQSEVAPPPLQVVDASLSIREVSVVPVVPSE